MKEAQRREELAAAWRVALESDDRVTKLRIETVLDGLGRAALAVADAESGATPDDREGDGEQQTPLGLRIN